MIMKFAIENFKGICDRLEFELKPVTLLFGAIYPDQVPL